MKFPVVQTKRFAQKLVLKKVERKVQAFVNSLGQERIEWMIQNQKPLASFLTAEQASAYSQKAKAVSWVASIVSDEDFDDMLPAWCQPLLERYGDSGALWFQQTKVWLRSFFFSSSA